jgi:1-deoxy-D-xylulose-5-phosphate synthase
MPRPPNEESLLSRLGSPADLRRVSREKLPQLAQELRRFVIERSGVPPRHLAASLGTVELAIALHYAYRTPQDRLIWDGGLQIHAHRILTGRRPRLYVSRHTRQPAGAIGRADLKYDHFAAGHASTSISAALGIAFAAARKDQSRRVVAVMGDRALAAGMAFEALNHGGSLPVDLLVVLNDGGDSMAGGVLCTQLARAFSGSLYGQLREGGKRMLQQLPTMRELARRSEKHLKGMVLPGTLFEEMGFNYTGPLDGGDVKGLVRTLENLRQLRGRQFLHVLTGEGRGRRRPPVPRSRAMPPHRAAAASAVTRDPPQSFAQAFGRWACDMAALDPRFVCVTTAPAVRAGLAEFAARFSQQFFAIPGAEQHAVTFAAGLAIGGHRPVVALGSSLLQRAYDQLIHDVSLQSLPVVFALDGAGFAGEDGAAHHGSYDLSFLRCIPGLTLAVPADENECRQLLYTASTLPGPSVVRFPSGAGPGVAADPRLCGWPSGRGEIRREGRSGLALLVFGPLLQSAYRVAERLDATLVNMRFVKPLDQELLNLVCARHEALVTIEENALAGGAGSAVDELLRMQGRRIALLRLGIPDGFIEHSSRESCLAAAGLDLAGLNASIDRWWSAQSQQAGTHPALRAGN